MPLMQDERALYAGALERIEAGELPGEVPKSVWGGKGGGDPCALCGKHIRRNEVEYEVQDAADRVFLFHLRCHAIWQFALSSEAERLGGESDSDFSRRPMN
jgi:hypothetical protein